MSPLARDGSAGRLRPHQATVRWRLTLLYGGLFLVCAAALLAVTYALVAHATTAPGPRLSFARHAASTPLQTRPPWFLNRAAVPPSLQKVLSSTTGRKAVGIVVRGQRISDLHQLEIESGIALGIMAIISTLMGWLVAGRVLQPLRTITATTREISEANLHRRLALPGRRDELRQLADTIDGLLGRLETAFDAQRQFVANASHELRTPLTTTRALLELAITDPHASTETFRAACHDALEENEQQEQLIDALLTLAQSQRELGPQELIQLDALVDHELGRQRGEAGARDLRIEAALAPAVISGNRRLVTRLISNLIENAIRHNPVRGQIWLTVDSRDGVPRFTIANTGDRIPPAEAARLLQPFQRLAPDRVGHDHGVGLGLSIVAAIANAHGATLSLEPRPGGGVEIEIRFRRPHPAHDLVPGVRATPPHPPEHSGPSPHREGMTRRNDQSQQPIADDYRRRRVSSPS